MLFNTYGREIIDKRTIKTTFQGPPIVLIGDDLFLSSDPRWIAVDAFVTSLGAPFGRLPPLIGLDWQENRSVLESGLQFLNKFFEVSADRPFPWVNMTNPTKIQEDLKLCGPIFCIATSELTRVSLRNFAWNTVTPSLSRTTAQNFYGIGNKAVSSGNPEIKATPPIYDFPTNPVEYAKKLENLREVWKRGGPIDPLSYATLQGLENGSRVGLTRKVHPALVPYLMLVPPA